MSSTTELFYNKIYNFLVNSPLNYITSFSVIYQIMKDEPLIEKDNLYKIISDVCNKVLETEEKFQDMVARDKLYEITSQVCLKIIKILNIIYHMMNGALLMGFLNL